MDWGKMIEAARAENANGIQMRGGKKYTTTAIRVEMMRRHAGALGITTEIVQWAAENGAPIVVKATIADDAGRVLATGHAEEIRGKGNVNATSALENAETSAIGRALAALGLSGGEFASANEMDGVERKATAIAERPKPAPAGVTDEAVTRATEYLVAATDADDLMDRWRKIPKPVADHATVKAAAKARKAELTARAE